MKLCVKTKFIISYLQKLHREEILGLVFQFLFVGTGSCIYIILNNTFPLPPFESRLTMNYNVSTFFWFPADMADMLLKWFARWCLEINIVLMSGIYCDVPKIKRKLRICTYAYLPITTPRTDIEIGNANHFNRRKDNHILKTLCVSRRTSAAGIKNFFLPNLTFLLEYVLLFYGHQGKDLVHQLSWNWFFESIYNPFWN